MISLGVCRKENKSGNYRSGIMSSGVVEVFLLLMLSEHSWLRTYSRASVTYPLFCIIAFLFYFLKKRGQGFVVGKNVFCLALFMLGIRILRIICYGFDPTYDIAFMLEVITAVFLVQTISYRECMENLRVVMLAVCIVSSIGYVLQFTTHFFSAFPQVRLHAGNFVCIGLANIHISNDYLRNFGMFYEPGIFQLYINWLLIYELFGREKKSVKAILIYVITIITTMSTAGYIGALSIFACQLVKRSESSTDGKFKKHILELLVIIIVAVFVLYTIGFINFRVFDKFNASDGNTSSMERFRAVRLAWQMFLANPLIGSTSDFVTNIYKDEYVILTCTPFNWFAIGGILYGLFGNIGYWGIVLKKYKGILFKTMLVITLLMLVFSQAAQTYLFMIIFTMYNYKILLKKQSF